MTLPKVQSHGINKTILIKLHQDLLEDILSRGYEINDEKLKEFVEFARLNSQVILFGVSELAQSNYRYKTSILSNFSSDYDGLNEFIKKEAEKRSYEDFSEWVLEKIKFAENFYLRNLNDIPSDEVEDKFLEVIGILELFLLTQYDEFLLPELIKIENNIKQRLEKIYNSDLPEQEAIDQSFEFLDEVEKTSVELFKDQIQEKLNDEAIKQAISAVAVLSLPVLAEETIATQRKIFEFGYLSNISAFFFNEIRRVKENVFDNISQGTNKRSLATDQLDNLSFNKNIFKLSTLAHPKALFRALVSKASDTNYYKALVPPSVLPTLDPKGFTATVLYTIKTKDEWAKTKDTVNINVVNGLSLHHGDQIYYKPIQDLEKEKSLAEKQRKVFLQSI
jgi:hypothetical protein